MENKASYMPCDPYTLATELIMNNFSGLSIRFCVIPLSPQGAMLQCTAVPLSKKNLITALGKQSGLGNHVDINSEDVPCLRLPFLGAPGISVSLGVVEDATVNIGMGLLPAIVLHGSPSPSPRLPSRDDMEREMIGEKIDAN